MRRSPVLLGVLILVAGAILLLRQGGPAPGPVPAAGGDRLFEAVFAKIRSSAVDPLDDEELYRRAAQGLIGELDDAYAFLQLPGQPAPPATDQPLPQGLFLDRRDGRAIVVAAVPGSPADRAGLRPGDVLVGIDTTAITGNRLETAVALLAGTPGTPVTLRIRRAGELLSPVLRRGPVPARPAVEVADQSGGVARLRLYRIGAGVADSVREAVRRLEGQGVRSLILDLRDVAEGGHDLTAGAAIADVFLDRGAVLAVTRMRRASGSRNLVDETPSPFAGMPLAVVIDGGTAGAAEVIAGALQDHDRAIVIGTESYGRGATWSSFSLGNGAVLTLTTALWLTPSGRQIQRLSEPAAPPGGGPLPRDSVARPTTKSDGGRVLTGGGGIVPDRVVAGGNGDLALAEARRILLRARSPATVFALGADRP
jgi:carboxyl-terminal processing protease